MKILPVVKEYAQKYNTPENRSKIKSGFSKSYKLFMCTSMMFLAFSRCSDSRSAHSSGSQGMKWAYEQGCQSIRDSLKIEELRDSLKMAEMYNNAAADSMKYFHSLKQCK